METRSLSKLTKKEKDLKILKLMNDLNVKVIVSCILQNYTLRYREILIRKLFLLYYRNFELFKRNNTCEDTFEKFIGRIINKSKELLSEINNEKRLISKTIRQTLNVCIEYRRNKILLLNGLVCDDLIMKIYEYVY